MVPIPRFRNHLVCLLLRIHSHFIASRVLKPQPVIFAISFVHRFPPFSRTRVVVLYVSSFQSDESTILSGNASAKLRDHDSHIQLPAPEPRKPFIPQTATSMYSRQKYYDRLMQVSGDKNLNLLVPPHCVPHEVYMVSQPKSGKPSSSLSTVLSIWNTMVGSTTLAVSWGFHNSGLIGIFLFLIIGILSYYTCVLVLKHSEGYQDFADVCRHYLGRWAQILAILCSCLVLIGALIAYQMYMSDSMWTVVGMFFPTEDPKNSNGWNDSLPAIIIFALTFPLLHFKTLTILLKFNAFGSFFVIFIIIFIFVKSVLQISTMPSFTPKFYDQNFGKLGGLLALSFFIHNSVIPILSDKTDLKRKQRDLAIGFSFAGLTYFVPGMLGIFVTFPQGHFEQNFLQNFPLSDIYSFFARFAIFLQLFSVFPLLFFILRVQFFGFFLQKPYPSFTHVFFLNLIIIGLSTACTYFKSSFGVGNVLRFTGAGCGLAYMYMLPVLVHVVISYRKGTLKWWHAVLNGLVVFVGVVTLIIQFPAVLEAITGGSGGSGDGQ